MDHTVFLFSGYKINEDNEYDKYLIEENIITPKDAMNLNELPYFPSDNAHLTYNAHPKLFYIPFEVQITRI